MRAQRFKATILDGHKGPAFEVPFDPALRWDIPAVRLRPGRHGHHVRGTLNGVAFESVVVARARRFFVLVDNELEKAAGIEVGKEVRVSLGPRDASLVWKPHRATARRPTTKKDPLTRIRQLCLALPETHEKVAWGRPTFRVCNKLFVMVMDNHHDDGRLAIWCKAPAGSQKVLVASDPEHFFVPPYVGRQGWVGIHLDRGLNWSVIAELVKEGYREAAPP